jgi:predicted transposase/invertase (TIGR01784 family)
MKAKYINPFTHFRFKKIVGEEASKPMLIDFLTNLLPEAHIVDLTFKDKEKLGKSTEDRKVIFDIYCENNNGEKIIVELQKAKQNYFKDRTVFYSTFPIQEQAEKGDWNYKLKSVFCIGILDFSFEYTKQEEKEVIHTIQLKDQHNQLFYDKLKFVYLEMPHFTKEEHQLETRLDKWLYFIKHLEDFQHIPEIFKDDVFIQAFAKAEISNYSEVERKNYEESLKTYRDLKSTIDTAFDEEKLEGIVEEKYQIAKNAKKIGLSIMDISKLTGLTADEIAKL